MIIIACILIASGAVITFFSKTVAELILQGKRKPNEADLVYTKLVGFALILTAAITVLI